jgi:hypothetical protein
MCVTSSAACALLLPHVGAPNADGYLAALARVARTAIS